MIRITVVIWREYRRTEEEFEVPAVPRIGEMITTSKRAAARVSDVQHVLPEQRIIVQAR